MKGVQLFEDSELRPSDESDYDKIFALYVRAFPDEDLVPLVKSLLQLGDDVVSLVMQQNDEILGHVCLSRCSVEPAGHFVFLFGPLCVVPEAQRKGIGSQLIKHALEEADRAKAEQVLVLGDPNYYGRFGFLQNSPVSTPFQLPEAWKPAWQYLNLKTGETNLAGKLCVPEPWQKPDLWTE